MMAAKPSRLAVRTARHINRNAPSSHLSNSGSSSCVAAEVERLLSAKGASAKELAALLKRCGEAKALSEGRLVHEQIKRGGHDRNVFLHNWLIQMYGDCGSVEEAVAVFDNLRWPNLHSWTMLMKVYVKNGLPAKAIESFQQMKCSGIEPCQACYVCALNACAASLALKEGQDLHAEIVQRGLQTDLMVGTALISMYGKCGCLSEAQSLFWEMPKKDLVAWNAMMSACLQNVHNMETLELFDRMQLLGFSPNPISFVCALEACSSVSALQKGQAIHTAVVDRGYQANTIVGTALVNMYGKCGRLEEARRVFDNMRDRDLVCWNTMIVACTQNGHCEEAIDLFHCMQFNNRQQKFTGLQPNFVTFVCVLDACASLRCLEKGRNIHAAIVEGKLEDNVFVSNALMNMYGRCKSVNDAERVFEKMSSRDVVSWNTMIALCSQNGQSKKSLEFFHEMLVDGVTPDEATFISVLDACSSLTDREKGREIHSLVVDHNYAEHVAVGSALVDMYGKCGDLLRAMSVFGRMPYRDVVAWNSMIAVCTQNGHDEEALAFFGQMQQDGIRPNHLTFVSVLNACSHMGWVEHGWLFFKCMGEELGIEHTLEHYACWIDTLGRAGHLAVAEDWIETLPLANKSSLWLCLLGACTVHADIDRGMRVASRVLALDPDNAGAYVLLSNIFAAAGRWTDAQKIRGFLKSWSKEETHVPS